MRSPQAISTEMGAPITLAKGSQTRIGVGHISAMIEVLKTFKFEERRGTTRLVQEPVGVCALITPWNWPMNQVAAKVVPALAAGCTMVLKPSEYSPFSAILWAKVMHEAGVPAGVFNLINGDGPNVGAPLSSHPEIDMVSFTGSTRAGTEVAKQRRRLGQARAPGARRQIAQRAARRRRLRARREAQRAARVPELRPVLQCADAHAGARRQARRGRGHRPARHRRAWWSGIPRPTRPPWARWCPRFSSIASSATSRRASPRARSSSPAAPGGPDGLSKGYYVKPTIFSNVRNDMTIAREEIFGPVLCILPYETEEQAVADRQRHALRARGLRVVARTTCARGASATASAPARSP